LAAGLAAKVFDASHGHEQTVDGATKQIVTYGLLYRRSQKTHMVRASVYDAEEDEYHIEFTYRLHDASPPPKDFKSPLLLTEALSEHTEEVEITCTGTFIYRQADGWVSNMPLPVEIPTFGGQPKLKMPFTHMESITFGRRDGESLDRSLGISITAEHNVRHSVFVTYVGNLDSEVPMNVLGDMVAISRPFVAKDEAAQ
jgi:hypothetical protein